MYRITITQNGSTALLHTDVPDLPKIAAGSFKEYVGTVPVLTLRLLPDHPCYKDFIERVTEITVTNTATGEPEFEGYLLSAPEKMTAAGKLYKELTFEGFLGYLNDSVQDYHTYTDAQPSFFITALLDYHNATTEASKHIYLGMVNAGQGGSKTTAYRSTLAEIKENLVNRFGGELRVRRGDDGRLLLDYLTAATNGSTSDTIIMLGHNLRSMSIESDTANIITRLMPLGAQVSDSGDSAERLTITGAVDPDDGHTYTVPFIDDAEAIARYGVIVGTAEFDDITVKENLVTRGKQYLSENNRVKKHYAASVLDRCGKGRIRCGDTYRFRQPLMGLDENLRLLGRTVDILKPYTPQVEIGDKTAKITDITAKTQHLINYEIPSQVSSAVQTAQRIATQLIEAATTGYVVMRPNEILIMDTDDVETATQVWRWNAGGLGYSSTGYHGTYGTAITMNGQIVADYIATGTMLADRILGGTLRLGGLNNDNGQASVRNAADQEVVHIDSNGIYSEDTGSGMRVVIINGRIYGFVNNSGTLTQFSEINPSVTFDDQTRGLLLRAETGMLQFDTICTEKSSHVWQGQDVTFEVVSGSTTKRLKFVNGLLVECGEVQPT